MRSALVVRRFVASATASRNTMEGETCDSKYDFTATPLRGRMSGALMHCLYHATFRASWFAGEPTNEVIPTFRCDSLAIAWQTSTARAIDRRARPRGRRRERIDHHARDHDALGLVRESLERRRAVCVDNHRR